MAADLTFLVMELAEAERGPRRRARGRVHAVRRSPGGDELLSFYTAYRAWVRAKVACLRAGELPEGSARQRLLEHARTLAALGERFAWRARGPLVIVVGGGAAAGETSLAEAISAASGSPT